MMEIPRLENVLSFVLPAVRNESAVKVSTRWRKCCIILALRSRAIYCVGAEGEAVHAPIAMVTVSPACTSTLLCHIDRSKRNLRAARSCNKHNQKPSNQYSSRRVAQKLTRIQDHGGDSLDA